ncbi:AMP binding protein [Rhodocollybia butyracea]|uniref:AMP binding protein n=1 Tax=Rhodocollybia butyracea TaxID=206335 RepID=A0A9P5Q7H2_9AGAR|nr:AMP binding protein [Rhodocollybia butyracea]
MSPRIYTSPYPSFPLESRSIFTHLLSVDPSNSKVGGFPAQGKAFIDAASGNTITRAELRSLALRFGYGLRHDSRIKAKRGDTVMLYCPNSLAYPVLLFGAIAAGLRCTLANNAYTARELEHQYLDSGAYMVITDNLDATLKMLEGLGLTHADAEKRVILLTNSFVWAGGAAASESENVQGSITFEQLLGLGELSQEEKFDEDAAQETVLLCYSSGTTGQPKGVETTHQNLTTAMQAINMVLGYDPGDRLLIFLPFYHIYGVVCGLLFPMFCNTTTIVMPRFDPTAFCSNVEKYRITSVLIVPPVMLAIARHPVIDKYNLSSIKLLFSSAAPLSPLLVQEGSKRLLAKRKSSQALYITEGYGMSETSPASHILPSDYCVTKMGSIGLLLPNYQARIVEDDSGESVVDAEEGKPGELWVRGPTVMKEKGTDKVQGLPRHAAVEFIRVRWAYSCFDTVPPAELERMLISHPEIADAAVIGVYSEEDATELPRAYVVHKEPAKLSAVDIRKGFEKSVAMWMESKVAKHKYLRGGVVVINEIPRSAAGKILRRELRELAKKESKLVQSKL